MRYRRLLGAGFALVCGMMAGTGATAQDLFKVIDKVFVDNGCIATEQQLFDAIKKTTGSYLDAQPTVLSWSNDRNFNQKYDVISRDPYTYRWKAGPCK